VVVVGGGLAGMSAALAAAAGGADVCLIDERKALGGPPHAVGRRGADTHVARDLAAAIAQSQIDTHLATVVWGLWDRQVALVANGRDSGVVEAERLIIATGAYERPVVFPGWTLPGVVTAVEAESQVRAHAGSPPRILVSGSGPGLVPLAARLRRAGATIVLVAQAAPRPLRSRNARLAVGARGDLGTRPDGPAGTYLRAHRVPILYSHLITRAVGDHAVEQAVVARVDSDWHPRGRSDRTVDVDLVCLAYGLVPSTELTLLSGATHLDDELRGGRVPVHDEWMRTTADAVLVAGACAGVGNGPLAVAEGQLAGIAAAMDVGRLSRVEAERRAAPVRRRLARLRQLRAGLDRVYSPGPGIHELATPETILCPCETVTVGRVAACLEEGLGDPSAIKAATRAGMGTCQGRRCARQLTALVARYLSKPIAEIPGFTPRPPVRPVPLGIIAAERPERPRASVLV
jgi:thioredoxin reductase